MGGYPGRLDSNGIVEAPVNARTADMPSDRTMVTDVATGLGMIGDDDIAGLVRRRPRAFVNLSDID